MKMTIEIIAEMLKWEADNYKKQYDVVQETKERELRELKDNFKSGTKMYSERETQIKNACDSAIAKLRVDAAEHNLRDIEELRSQELERVQTIDVALLEKIRAISDIPMTTAELAAFAAKINAKNDYWASRMLSCIGEKYGVDSAAIGLESTFDTKMSVLDQLESQLDKVLKFYGTKTNDDEKMKARFLYLNDDIVERAKKIYGGKLNKLSDSQRADKAYLTIRAQQTDIQKGIAISNALKNAKGETRNLILCKLAADNSISSMAAEFSGHMNEITEFKNGKLTEYRNAQKALDNICKMRDVTMIEQTIQQMEENSFFGNMLENEKAKGGFLAEMEITGGATSDRYAELYKKALDKKAESREGAKQNGSI